MSPFTRRKAETLFFRLDVDRDGEITLKDFEAMAEKLIKSGKLDIDRGTALREKLAKKWNLFFNLKEFGGRPITREKFSEIGERVFQTPEFRDASIPLWHLLFASIDTDEDGSIQEKEFIQFFEILDISADAARASFQTIDTDNDGVLSIDEYVAAGVEFLSSDDKSSPARFFWGPLV